MNKKKFTIIKVYLEKKNNYNTEKKSHVDWKKKITHSFHTIE